LIAKSKKQNNIKTMNTRQAYNIWSQQYDFNENKTRDLEAQALQETLQDINFETCLEIGCGTGKNTACLITKAQPNLPAGRQVTAVDLSEEMLAKAKEKINNDSVQFVQADITGNWVFAEKKYDLVTFSLVLEHIQNLDHIFNEVDKCLVQGGHVYIGELHPFKQYSGSKARFETADGTQVVECFTHHLSEFIQTAKKYNLTITAVNEYFDDGDTATIPRILVLVFTKV
jgi:ubiquinone/menaquinone biosynthesis C-methylase UbiE